LIHFKQTVGSYRLKKMMLSHFLPSIDVTIVYLLSEWNGYVIHVWVYLQQRNHSSARDLFSENSLTQFWCSM